MSSFPTYFFRGTYRGSPKAPSEERKLQILRILNKIDPKWTAPSTTTKELGISIVNARNLLRGYAERGAVKGTSAKLGKYKLTVYRLTDHGRYELDRLEKKFAGKMV